MFAVEVIFVIIGFHLLQNIDITEACSEIKPEDENLIIDTITELGRKISYAQWDNDPTMNIVLSPLSIAVILNLLMAGTKGNTSSEIKQAMNYPNDLEECVIHQIYQNIFTFIQDQPETDIEITLSTKLFLQKEFPILESFRNISGTYYFSEDENLDFANSPENATERINEWVYERTKGKIEKLFPEPLSSDTVFVFVNVIFFNATWENKFNPSFTVNGTFQAETGNITIPMMSRDMEVPYLNASDEGLQLVALPYVGNRFSMYILKPIDDSGTDMLQEIENNTNPSDLENLINRMEPTLIDVTIPRMKLNFRVTLNDDLKDFGINEIFNPGADFGRTTTEPNLALNMVIHNAVLEVTENGTVAAAVTAAGVGITSLPPPLPIFILDKPSLLFIRDDENGVILFWSRVMKPEPYWY